MMILDEVRKNIYAVNKTVDPSFLDCNFNAYTLLTAAKNLMGSSEDVSLAVAFKMSRKLARRTR
jgi:hypothetical protein